ncbi:MAG: ATP-binding protein [Ruminococcaceae bacterium]|nr:ATP-binding protein [Oscillospiraceae bacterium]
MKELTVDAVPKSLRQIKAFVDAELAALDCPLDTRRQMDIAVDEVFGNIVHYAYSDAVGSVKLRFEAEQTPLAVTLTFLDSGIPFDPLQAEAPDTSLAARERAIGGLGIFVVKKLMDEVCYEYADGKNVLRLKKILAE